LNHTDGPGSQELGPAREAELLKLLSGFASKSELFQSFLILGEMKRAGLDIRKAYNGVLGVCGRASDFEAAVSAFEAMRSDGIVPDLSSYTNLIRALGGNGESGVQNQRRLVRVFLVFMEMQSAGVSPDLIFMNGLIEACRRCGAPDKAREVFLSMSQLGLVPDAASYSSWLLACVECEEMEHALEVVERMDVAGVHVSKGSWASLLSGLGRCGKAEAGLRLLVADDSVGPGALLKGLCQHGDLEEVELVLREMRRRHLVLPTGTERFLRVWRARIEHES
jgi:pentatricopeptide repeat protein